jgi:hypothetical protein
MPTGYEVDMYRDIHRIAEALERISNALEDLVQVQMVAGDVAPAVLNYRRKKLQVPPTEGDAA